MVLRPCLGTPGRPCTELLRAGSRCGPCAAAAQRAKRGRRAEHGGSRYGAAEQARRAAAVDAHVQEHGAVCPGWRRPPHTVARADLTADHTVPVAAGGAEQGRLGVLCRPCNSAKGARRGG